jgi:hypothetical protein
MTKANVPGHEGLLVHPVSFATFRKKEKFMKTGNKIIQIIPADHWYALRNFDTDRPDKIVCFALYENGTIRGIIPKGDGTVLAACDDTFERYVNLEPLPEEPQLKDEPCSSCGGPTRSYGRG